MSQTIHFPTFLPATDWRCNLNIGDVIQVHWFLEDSNYGYSTTDCVCQTTIINRSVNSTQYIGDDRIQVFYLVEINKQEVYVRASRVASVKQKPSFALNKKILPSL